jgi:predicted GNAT family acetyltransferase
MDFTNNTSKKQYKMVVEETMVVIDYMEAQDRIYLTHTEVPKGLEGKGYGSKIVQLALEDIEKRDLKLVPLCPFVAAFLKRHPEWKRILWEGVNIG